MTGEPREDMNTPMIGRLPPVVTSHRLAAASDAALGGGPLPPYRPGMYTGLMSDHTVSALSAALESPTDVGPPVAEGWPAAWRDDPMPAGEEASVAEDAAAPEPAAWEEPAAWQEEAGADVAPETAGFLDLGDADVEEVDAERDPTGYEQAAEDLEPPAAQPIQAMDDEGAAWAWDAEETVVYDLPGAADEDTGPWQDTWAAPVEPFEQEAGSGESFGVADAVAPAEDEGPEPAGDVQEWLETGTVENYGWDLGGEPSEVPGDEDMSPSAIDEAVLEPWAEPAGLDAMAEPLQQEHEPDGWSDADVGAETGDVIEMVEERGPGASIEFAPADAPAGEEEVDERVAIVPPTPLDSWVHGEHGAEAEATWEAFGRALEEAASWGDLDTTIATGLTPEEARGEVERAPAVEHPVAQPAPASQAEATADPAVTDLARRLEHLAQRLRAEGEKGVEHAMAEGDRLEASLAGFIAGYVAARRG